MAEVPSFLQPTKASDIPIDMPFPKYPNPITYTKPSDIPHVPWTSQQETTSSKITPDSTTKPSQGLFSKLVTFALLTIPAWGSFLLIKKRII